jgi:periplasmic divalent cation tolerance protein
MAEYLQVSTATETREQAVELAKSIVAAKLAAGAQIVGPVTSVFWHLGEFGTGEEWQLLLKARADRYPEIEAHLIEHHQWNNPEVVATAIQNGSADYLQWVGDTTALESTSETP